MIAQQTMGSLLAVLPDMEAERLVYQHASAVCGAACYVAALIRVAACSKLQLSLYVL